MNPALVSLGLGLQGSPDKSASLLSLNVSGIPRDLHLLVLLFKAVEWDGL